MERCATCKRPCPVSGRGRVEAHDTFIIGDRCRGSGHSSCEELDRQKAADDARMRAEIEAARGLACVALDALLEGRRDVTLRYREAVRLALGAWELKFGMQAHTTLRRGWWVPEAGQYGWNCRFCGHFIGVGHRLLSTGQPGYLHVEKCALSVVAGILDPPPGLPAPPI